LEIARSAGKPLLIDAAQTVGRLSVREEGASVLIACSAHKGLFGLPGLGILTIPPGLEIAKWRLGGTGTVSESLEHPEELPMRFEAGTLNAPAIASTLYGLEFIEAEGMDKIHEKELSLAQKLLDFLRGNERFEVYSDAEGKESIAVVAFNLRGVSSQEVSTILDQRFGIAVRGGLHCAAVLHQQLGTVPDGCVRVSPGYYNTPDEIDTLTAALAQIAESY
jgi:selenocysteine lyase/cysteine desulfurase